FPLAKCRRRSMYRGHAILLIIETRFMLQSQCERSANSAANPLLAILFSQGGLGSAAERAPGEDLLPSPLEGLFGISPSRQRAPSGGLAAQQNRLVGRQILPALGYAGYEREAIAAPRRLVEGRCISGVAAQQIEPAAARCGLGEHASDHRGDA